MRKSLRCFGQLCALVFGTVFAVVSFAKVVPQLNWGHVLVADRSTATAQATFPKALQQVLIKYSGQVNVASMPNVQQFLQQSGQLVQQYSFSAHPDTPDTPWQLNVAFAKKPIERYLLNSNLSLWSPDRPETLAYIYINDSKNTQVLNSSDAPLQTKYMQQVAKQRGVPLLWPLYDLQDQQQVSFNQPPTSPYLVGDLPENIQDYWFQRYQSGSLLYGLVWNSGVQWYGSWLAKYNGQSTTWINDGTDVNSVLGEAVAQMANYLAGQMSVYAQSDEVHRPLEVWVSNLGGLQTYKQALHYLQSLAPVTSVSVGEINPNGVLFTVNTQISPQDLMKSLQQGGKLQHILLPAPYAVPLADMYYKWKR